MRILIEEYPGSVDAARFLIAARDAGVPGPRLPADCRPQTQGQAFAVQRSTARLLRETRRDDIAAWKSALPTPEKSVVAPIYTSTVHFSAASPVPSHGAVVRVEPDRLRTGARPARARTAQRSRDRCRRRRRPAGAGSAGVPLRAAEHASLPELLADHMFNQGLVLGPRIASADDAPASMTITLSVDGQDAEQHAGIHPNRPKAGLYWLANFLREQGAGLRAGQHVITGSYAGFLDVPAGRDLEIAYGDLGVLRLRFEARGCSAAGARLYCGAGPRACRARRHLAHTRPATMLTLRPLTAEDHSLLAGWFSSLADVVQWGGSQLSYPLTPLRGNHAVGRPEHAARAPLLDGLPRWRAGRTCAARL